MASNQYHSGPKEPWRVGQYVPVTEEQRGQVQEAWSLLFDRVYPDYDAETGMLGKEFGTVSENLAADTLNSLLVWWKPNMKFTRLNRDDVKDGLRRATLHLNRSHPILATGLNQLAMVAEGILTARPVRLTNLL